MNRRRFLGWSLAGWELAAVFPGVSPAADPRRRARGPGVLPGEMLCNGIRLPKQWPPAVAWDDIKARKPLPEPPYLQSPPEVIPIDLGRQLFVDDFLIEQSTLRRTYHRAEYHEHNPVFTGGMVYSGGVWHDPKDHLFKMWYHADGTSYTTSKDGIHWAPGAGAERADRLADGLA